METPCIKICQLDIMRQYCLGCKRTVKEIQEWYTFTDQQRKQIMEELKGR